MKKTSHIIGLISFMALLLAFSGCGKLIESAIEKGIEKETGKKVDVNLGAGGLSLKGENGEQVNFQAGKNGEGVVSYSGKEGAGVLRVDKSGVTGVSDKGSFQVSQSIPAHFPKDVPVYASSSAVNGTEALTPTGALSEASVSLSTEDSAEKVAAFYRDLLPKNGWKISYDSGDEQIPIIAAAKTSAGETWHVNIIIGVDTSTAVTKTVITLQVNAVDASKK